MTNKLPIPPEQLQQQSFSLQSIIKQKIKNHGFIRFTEFMHDCLYTPQLGYYSSGLKKFGKHGDFVTAPELSPLFSACIAQRAQSTLPQLAQQNILEVGAGSGLMAAHILAYFEINNIALQHYYILDVSANLKQTQKQSIEKFAPNMLSKVIWLDDLPPNYIGFVIANELLDAMPVHLFSYLQNQLFEKCVTLDEKNNFCFQMQPVLPENAHIYLNQFKTIFSENYTSEINLAVTPWLQKLYRNCEQCVVLLIDYGFEKQTYYHSQRTQGTLICHYQHFAHDDAFFYPGLQDITAHVDFSFVAHAAFDLGFTIEQYTTQADFLLTHNILAHQQPDQITQYQQAQSLKRLLLPDQMGESFKLLAISKNYPALLENFCMRDMRGVL